MNYEVVIGLETHVELSTETKIFCGCSTEFGGEENTHVCPVCLGMPGALPVLNRKVLEYAIKTGLAMNCKISDVSRFDRKNYFYPDLPKSYQISQLYAPICRNGYVNVRTGKEIRQVRIREIHMEEDAGKLIHDRGDTVSLVDYNRAGVPLLEIVSEPDLRSGEEAVAYLETLKLILQYLGVSDCKMQEGSMRADVNVSVRPMGSEELGTRTEIKNMNSFRAIVKAIKYEKKRQTDILQTGGKVIQETRGWDEDKEVTFSMRSKEDVNDYRYFPDPDLPPVYVSETQIRQIMKGLPELPDTMRTRYIKEYGLPEHDADVIIGSLKLAQLFEAVASISGKPKEASNMIMGDLLKLINDTGCSPEKIEMRPEAMAVIIELIGKNKINRAVGKLVLEKVFIDKVDPIEYIKEQQLFMITDEAEVREIVEAVLAENQQSVNDFINGKQQARGYLVGQSMRALKGKADPAVVNRIVDELLVIKK